MGVDYVAVLPFVHRPWLDECLDGCRLERDRLVLVDNTETNLGVMRSHNLGIDELRRRDAEWLVVVSAAMRFGPAGGLDFVDALAGSEFVVEAANVFGWHLIAFHREVLERVGRWDENFTPYGFDDLDLSWRIQVAFEIEFVPGRLLWRKVAVDASDAGMGHSVRLAGVEAPAEPRLAYLCRKWGVELAADGAKSPFRFRSPFDSGRDVRWWPRAENGGRWDD